MKKLRLIAIIFALLLSGGWVVLFLTRPKEPTYEGRTLTEWLIRDESDSNATHGDNYERAIRAIGTNGIPTLLRLLTVKDSQRLDVRDIYWAVVLRDSNIGGAEYKHRLASLGFGTLGQEAKSATSELIRLAKSGEQPGIRTYALWCLEGIKPEKEILFPVLAQSTNDVDWQVAKFASERLYNLQHNLYNNPYADEPVAQSSASKTGASVGK